MIEDQLKELLAEQQKTNALLTKFFVGKTEKPSTSAPEDSSADAIDYKSECRVLAQQLVNADQKDVMVAALKKHGKADKLSLIKDDKLPAVYDALKALADI